MALAVCGQPPGWAPRACRRLRHGPRCVRQPREPAGRCAQINYAIGAIVGSSPDYAGGDGRKNSLRPAWAIEYGHFA